MTVPRRRIWMRGLWGGEQVLHMDGGSAYQTRKAQGAGVIWVSFPDDGNVTEYKFEPRKVK